MRQHEIRLQFSKNIKTLRINRGLTQEQYAHLIDANKRNMGSWEENICLPSVETLVKICKLEELTLDDVLTKEVKGKLNVLSF